MLSLSLFPAESFHPMGLLLKMVERLSSSAAGLVLVPGAELDVDAAADVD